MLSYRIFWKLLFCWCSGVSCWSINGADIIIFIDVSLLVQTMPYTQVSSDVNQIQSFCLKLTQIQILMLHLHCVLMILERRLTRHQMLARYLVHAGVLCFDNTSAWYNVRLALLIVPILFSWSLIIAVQTLKHFYFDGGIVGMWRNLNSMDSVNFSQIWILTDLSTCLCWIQMQFHLGPIRCMACKD